MMRIFRFIPVLVLLALAVGAYEGNDIAVSFKDRPVYELLDELRDKGGLSIVYSKEQLTKDGVTVTINLELPETPAELVLEVAALAAGFSYEKKASIFVILPVKNTAPPAAPASAPPATAPAPAAKPKDVPAKVTVTKKPEKPENSVEVVPMATKTAVTKGKRYTGSFMYGQGDAVYLNLNIPTVNSDEEERITKAMTAAISDFLLNKNEAVELFGNGSEIGGKKIAPFLKMLMEALEAGLKDKKLTATEINKVRNDFINSIRASYEGL